MPEWILYGAYGYTGELIAREAAHRQMTPLLAGRRAEPLSPLAEELKLESAAFDIKDAREYLRGKRLLLNCAGPFSATAETLMDACLAEGVHYFDITGEIAVFQSGYARDQRAREADVILCPGVGFDVVPSDCLAKSLRNELDDVTHLTLSFFAGGGVSIGTRTTIVEGIRMGGQIRRAGQLKQVPLGYRIRRIPFADKQRWAVTIPWGDVFTSGVSTGAPNGEVFAAVPLVVAIGMKLSAPFRFFMATRFGQACLRGCTRRFLPRGPNAKARIRSMSRLWGEAVASDGRRVTGTMTTPNAYDLTVDAALETVAACLQQDLPPGYATPSMLLGADFCASLRGVEQRINSPVSE